MPFQTTLWSAISRAKAGSREALESLLARYRPPVFEYVCRRGIPAQDAEDVVQEVFLEICQEDLLRNADREKGRLRSLILRITQNVLASRFRKQYRLKRGGGRKALPLEEVAQEESEDRFNELWARNLLRIGLQRLGRQATRCKVPYHEVLLWKYLDGLSYEQIGERLKCTSKDVDNYCYQGKQMLKRILTELAREYSSSPEEHDAEIELLRRYLG